MDRALGIFHEAIFLEIEILVCGSVRNSVIVQELCESVVIENNISFEIGILKCTV